MKKMTGIIERLNRLVTFDGCESMTDEDFIADIDAANLLCCLHDDLGLDRTEIRSNMERLYPQLIRRIEAKQDIQYAMPLIRVLYRLIYDRDADEADRGPIAWRDTLVDLCRKVAESYRKQPLTHSADYLFALDIICRTETDSNDANLREYRGHTEAYLDDIDEVTVAEKTLRADAYNRSRFLFSPGNRDKWAETIERLKYEDTSRLDDETLLVWWNLTDITPERELKKRSCHSARMQVAYLQSLIFAEFNRMRREAAERELAGQLKSLHDDDIGDIINVEISSAMSLEQLYELQDRFWKRYEQAEIADDDNLSAYHNLCRSKYLAIDKALTKKYRTATPAERTDILERLQDIEYFLYGDYSDFLLAAINR